MNKIKVGVWGFGNMGQGIIKALLKKTNFELCGIIVDYEKELVGKTVSEVLPENISSAKIYNSLESFLKENKPEVIIQATASFMKQVEEGLARILSNSINAISIAEEASFPWTSSPEIAKKLDNIANEHRVSLVGTGINPGFILDTLVIALTGACLDIEYIEASRINDLSPFGRMVMKTQGVGTSVEEFNAGLKNQTIVGHIGFPESINLIAKAVGWKIDKIVQKREPIVSDVYRDTSVVKVEKGMVAGCNHIAEGYVSGELKIKLIHPQQIHPHLADVKTGDYIKIKGTPDINISNTPEIPGGIGTIALAINTIPGIIAAKPGYRTMSELPLVSAKL